MAKLDTAATPKMFHINDPMIVPRPMSDAAINVLMTFVNISGVAVAVAMNTAAPTSCYQLAFQKTHIINPIILV